MIDPIDYPVVEVGGRKYTLKYSLGAKYHLSRQGISEADLLSALASFEIAAAEAHRSQTPTFAIPIKWLSAVIDAWAACVAHTYANSADKPPTSEQWADKLESEFAANPRLPMQLYIALRTAILKAPRPPEAAQVAGQVASPSPN